MSRIVDGARRYDVVVRLDDRRRTTDALADLLIETPSRWIPLRPVAERLVPLQDGLACVADRD